MLIIVLFLMWFPDCETSDCIAVEIELRDSLGMIDTDIRINRTLVNTEAHLVYGGGVALS